MFAQKIWSRRRRRRDASCSSGRPLSSDVNVFFLDDEMLLMSTSAHRFPPGTSDIDLGLYWKDAEPDAKYLCLDSPVEQRQQQPMTVCAGCRLEITDRYFLRVNPNLEFHSHCLKCVQCARPLDENQTAFVRNGQTYCRDDYRSLFVTRCSRCQEEFKTTDYVMRAGPQTVFHVSCFSCVACEKRLQTGEEFQIKNNNLYCGSDCICAEHPDASASVPEFGKLQNNNNNNNNNSSSNFDEDEWDEERSTLTSLDNNTSSPLGSPKSDGVRTPLFGHHSGGSGGSSSSCGKKKKDKQATRVRTVLNEQQLRILKDCYSNNSRPDATIKERLVEMTGLNARVIRVWFQNKRCKDKKRQIQINETRLNSEREEVLQRVRVNGIGPLMVQPATPHMDTSLGGPLDIQHFPQWPTSPPPPPQFGNPMMFSSPIEMTPFGVSSILAPVAPAAVAQTSEVIGPAGAAVFPHYSPQEHGSLTATSHGLASPSSCSE
ncbi:unnamed protein product [Caenorhabditis sp. 36 PRJEB53466]|nr:unnamed protein product [Caenorhabditis sp. 36 PRJEB53466]